MFRGPLRLWDRGKIAIPKSKCFGPPFDGFGIVMQSQSQSRNKSGPGAALGSWQTTAVVARELAMRLVDFSFPPDAEHTPGIGHVLADRLSRVYSPTGRGHITMDLHPALATASESIAPTRDSAWYQT